MTPTLCSAKIAEKHGECRVCHTAQTDDMRHYVDSAGKIVCEACVVPFVLAGEVQ